MACNNCGNISDTCGEKIFAPCIYIENTIPECSSLYGNNCVTLDEVVDDVYSLICDLKIDLSDFEPNCIDYNEDYSVVNILQVHNTEICSIKDTLDSLQNICNILNYNITDCNIDYSCLIGTDPCGDSIIINTLSDLIQVLINKVCALEKV